jgi:hypothetical protein
MWKRHESLELLRMWKEAITWQFLRGTEDNTGTSLGIASVMINIHTGHILNTSLNQYA